MDALKGLFGYGSKAREIPKGLEDGDEYHEKVLEAIKILKANEKIDKIEKKFSDYCHVHLVTAALDILAEQIKENKLINGDFNKRFAKLGDFNQKYTLPKKGEKKPALTYPVKLLGSIVRGLPSAQPNLQNQVLSILRLSFSLMDAALTTAATIYKRRLTKQNSELLNNALLEAVGFLMSNQLEPELIERIMSCIVEYYRKKVMWHDHPILPEAVVFCYVNRAARVSAQDSKGLAGTVLDPVRFLVTWQHLKQEHVLDMFRLLGTKYSTVGSPTETGHKIQGVSRLHLQLHWNLFMQCFGLIFDKWDGTLTAAVEVSEPLQKLFIQEEAARSLGDSDTGPWEQYTQCRKMISEAIKLGEKQKAEFTKYWLDAPAVKYILESSLDDIKEGRLDYSAEIAFCLWQELTSFALQLVNEEQTEKLSSYILEAVSTSNNHLHDRVRSKLLKNLLFSFLNPKYVEKFKISVPAATLILAKRLKAWITGCSSPHISDLVKELDMLLLKSKESFDYQELKKLSLELLQAYSKNIAVGPKDMQNQIENIEESDLQNLRVNLARFATNCWHHEIFLSERSPATGQAMFKEIGIFFRTGMNDLIETLEAAKAYNEVNLVKAMTSSLFWAYSHKFQEDFNRTAQKMMEMPNNSKLIKIFYHKPNNDALEAESLVLELRTHKSMQDWRVSSCDLLMEDMPHFEYTLYLIKEWLRPLLRISDSKLDDKLIPSATHLLKCGYTLLTKPDILQPDIDIPRERLWLQLFCEWSYALLDKPGEESPLFSNVIDLMGSDTLSYLVSPVIAPVGYKTIFQIIQTWEGYLQHDKTYEDILCKFCRLLDRWRESTMATGGPVEPKHSLIVTKLYLQVLDQMSWRLASTEEKPLQTHSLKKELVVKAQTHLDTAVDNKLLTELEADTLRREMMFAHIGPKGFKFTTLKISQQQAKLAKLCEMSQKHAQKPVWHSLRRHVQLKRIEKGLQVLVAGFDKQVTRKAWSDVRRFCKVSRILGSLVRVSAKAISMTSSAVMRKMRLYAQDAQEQAIQDLGIQGAANETRIQNPEPAATPEALPGLAAIADPNGEKDSVATEENSATIEETPFTTEAADPVGEAEIQNLTSSNPFDDDSDDKDKPTEAENGQDIKDPTTDESMAVAQGQAGENPFSDSPPQQSLQLSQIPASQSIGPTEDLHDEFHVIDGPSV